MTTTIRGVKGARTGMVALEDLTDEELAGLKREFDRLHQRFDDAAGEGDAPPKQPRRRPGSERPPARAS